jgi:hypothetical protein
MPACENETRVDASNPGGALDNAERAETRDAARNRFDPLFLPLRAPRPAFSAGFISFPPVV